MFSLFRQSCERVLRLPPDPAPPDDEAHARVFRAAPRFYQYKVVLWLIGTAFALLFVCVGTVGPIAAVYHETRGFQKGGPAPLIVVVILLLVLALVVLVRLFALAVLRLDYEKRWYVVTDRSLRIREGVVAVREMTVTFANIQNVSLAQGPLQRMLGIADVVVETAGGGAIHAKGHAGANLHTAAFRGIDNAAEVQTLIQTRLRLLKDSGLGHHEERPGPAAAGDFLDALRAVHAEARALRKSSAR